MSSVRTRASVTNRVSSSTMSAIVSRGGITTPGAEYFKSEYFKYRTADAPATADAAALQRRQTAMANWPPLPQVLDQVRALAAGVRGARAHA